MPASPSARLPACLHAGASEKLCTARPTRWLNGVDAASTGGDHADGDQGAPPVAQCICAGNSGGYHRGCPSLLVLSSSARFWQWLSTCALSLLRRCLSGVPKLPVVPVHACHQVFHRARNVTLQDEAEPTVRTFCCRLATGCAQRFCGRLRAEALSTDILVLTEAYRIRVHAQPRAFAKQLNKHTKRLAGLWRGACLLQLRSLRTWTTLVYSFLAAFVTHSAALVCGSFLA